jgi:cytochrome b subunit of formate dehydrogenase
MTIGGVSLILILGICNLILVLFQAATGLRLVKVKFGVHKKAGLLLVVLAATHGLLAFLANR